MLDAASRSKFDIVPWNPSFATNIPIIDEQHRQLVALINDLAHEYVYGGKAGEAERILEALIDYAAYHFETEEALWAEVLADDDWYTGHLHTHSGFVNKVLDMQSNLKTGNRRTLIDGLLSFLTGWLAHHILYEDKRFSLVFLQVHEGVDLDTAKQKAHEAMTGQTSGLIQSVLSMYKELSSRTLALEHEAYSREVAEQALLDQEQHWSSVLGASSDSLWDWDLTTIGVMQDEQLLAVDRFSQNGFTVHPSDWPSLQQGFLAHVMGQSEVFEHQYRVTNTLGNERWIQSRGKIIEQDSSGRPKRMVGTHTDVTERKTTELTLQRLAFQDSLTGLPNRRSIEGTLADEMGYCERHGQRLVLALLDLDNFRDINEEHGAALGDVLLKALAQRMRRLFNDAAVIARVGGDEFVVLFRRLLPEDNYFQQLNRLLAVISEPLMIDGIDIIVSSSIGVTEFPQPMQVSAEQLVRQTQHALFQAKTFNKGHFQKYDIGSEHNARARLERLEQIRKALHSGEFILYYQPKVHMKTGVVFGVEALVRWQKSTGELVPPSEFLPALYNNPLEVELGDWVIRTALAQMRLWKQQGLEIQVSVNVSSGQLFDDAFVEKLSKDLEAYSDIAPSALQLEVLESSMLTDLNAVSGIMQRSRQLGISFALDDFGTGYSSLAYLKHLPASVLKIDQSFVREMIKSTDDLSIISGVIGMANAFGMQVLAEGVESIEQGDLLLRLGCEEAQGYGIAKPMLADELPAWLQGWKAVPSWIGQQAIEVQSLPLLYAEVEHRRWVVELERWLRGESEDVPVLDYRQCKVGLWINSEAHSRFGLYAKYAHLDHLHRDLHTLGQSAVSMHAKGEAEAALMMLPQVQQQCDLLLAELRMLIG